MKTNNIIQEKSFKFSIRIIRLFKYLTKKHEYIISKQILKSGTSIGANIEESIGSISTKDFLHKISIAYREARETYYWLKLLVATEYININQYNSISSDCFEIIKIIGKIQLSTKTKLLQTITIRNS